MKALIISSTQTPLGSGLDLEFDSLFDSLTTALTGSDVEITVLAKKGSAIEHGTLIEFEGTTHIAISGLDRKSELPTPADSIVKHMMDYAFEKQAEFDVIINTAYEWLPFYLTKYFKTPIYHLLTHHSVNDAMDEIIESTAKSFPKKIAVFSKSQASSYSKDLKATILKGGIDIKNFVFQEESFEYLVWNSPITSDSGLELALDAAQKTNLELHIIGGIVDELYFRRCLKAFSRTSVCYHGSLEIAESQAIVGGANALLVTSSRDFAFQSSVFEALACGTPVIAPKQGPNAEHITEGRTGALYNKDSIKSLLEAIDGLADIDRQNCRAEVEKLYKSESFAAELSDWLRAEATPRIEVRKFAAKKSKKPKVTTGTNTKIVEIF